MYSYVLVRGNFTCKLKSILYICIGEEKKKDTGRTIGKRYSDIRLVDKKKKKKKERDRDFI